AIFYTLPTRVWGYPSNGGPTWATGLANLPGAGGTPQGNMYLSNNYQGPNANGYSGGGYNSYVPDLVDNAIMVYQNYGDASRNWVPNFLSCSGMVDTDTTTNWPGESGSNYSTNIRQPMGMEPTFGIDGLFHMRREVVWQRKGNTDMAPVTRGTLPASFVFCGVNAGNDGNPIVAGSETYTITNINLGFWPHVNPNGFAIRSA
ncbi:MAG: hypothetical protein KGR26_02935, partial [Cyanobacteria bacterium REEB65]|nr:hypothetical protein [Cyanobacteria bacterium REEB65]